MPENDTPITHEYVNSEGERHGTYAGTEVDAAFRSSPEWFRDADADGGIPPIKVEKAPQILEVPNASAEPGNDPDVKAGDDYPQNRAPLEPRSDDNRVVLSRPELNDLARDAGVENPEGLRTKAAVIAAIDGVQASDIVATDEITDHDVSTNEFVADDDKSE